MILSHLTALGQELEGEGREEEGKTMEEEGLYYQSEHHKGALSLRH